MIEDVKIDNNCIIKAFENHPISILQENIRDRKIYYFKASDIGKALDDDEQVVRKAYDLRGCEQDTTFLTSQGVYRLLYNSKKPIAKKFRKWAGNILDDIIFNHSKELQKQIEKNQEQLLELESKNEQLKKEKELERHNILLKEFGTVGCIVYIVCVKLYENGEYVIKIGESRRGIASRYI
jgi:hypothetical protein